MRKNSTPVFSLKNSLPLALSLVAVMLQAQTRTQAEMIRNKTNVSQLEKIGAKIKNERPTNSTLQSAAQRMKIPFRGQYQNMVYQLKDFSKRNKLPLYYATQNVGAAQGTGTDKLNSSAGIFNLDGQGMVYYEWDGGKVLTTHQEFGGRVTQKDAPASLSDHSTHVAGTIVASGVNKAAKGMAPKASLNAYDWTDDETEMAAAAANAALVSNHSYGYLGGYEYGNWSGNNAWHWFGTDDETEYSGFGKYSSYDAEWDLIANSAPYYLPVKAAGNPRGSGPAAGGSHYVRINNAWTLSTKTRQVNGGQSGYDCVIFGSTAKNILTVGAASKMAGGYSSPADVKAASFSGFGPTDDGRIKPDITGIGVDLFSTISTGNANYESMSGTSMASPNVTGSLGLLQQHYKNLNNDTFMKAATLKALAIGTAKEAGNPGPDYSYGWGLLDAFKAAQTISARNKYSLIEEKNLANGTTDEVTLVASGTEPIVATIVWNDPAPVETADETPLNDRKIMLVNDLDARVTSGNDTFEPWVMNPETPNANATKGDNIRDNVEQVVIPNPVRGATYTLKVSHKGTLKKNEVTADAIALVNANDQAYSLVVTGIMNNVNTDLDLKSLKVAADVKNYSAATPVEAVVVNQGAQEVSGAVLNYKLTEKASGNTAATGSVPVPTVASGATVTLNFPVDLSKSFVDYDLSAEVAVAGDELAINNKQSINVFATLVDLTPAEASHTFGFEQEFEKYGWLSEDIDGDGRTWYKYDDASFAHSGGSFAINFPNLSYGTHDWLFSNPLKMKAGGKYRVIFYASKLRANEEKLNVSFGTEPKSSAMTTAIAKDISTTANYVRYVYEFSPAQDNVYYIGFQHNMPASAQTYAVFLDDVTVDQSEKPVVDFAASKIAASTFDDVNFTPNIYSNVPVTGYNWTFTPNTVTYQNGTTATSDKPVVKFNAEGTYTVKLDVDNGKGIGTAEKVAYITVKNTAPVAAFSSDYTDVYKNSNVSFSDASTGAPAPTSWTWEITPTKGVSFMNGTSATSKNPVVNFSEIGKYSVKLTATSPAGSNSVSKTDYINVINVNPVRNLTGTADAATKNVTLKWVRPVIDTKFYTESFEGATKLSAIFDEDGDTKNWQVTSTSTYVRTGTKAAISYSWATGIGTYDVDNWIVTSKIPKGAEQLSFWIRHSYKEQLDVYVVRKENVAGTAPTLAEVKAGTKVFDDTTTAKRANYTNITADLKPFSGSDVFIAFHHKTRKADDGFMLLLDDIEVGYDNKLPAAATPAPVTPVSDGKTLSTEDGLPVERKTENAVTEPILATYAVQPAPVFSGYEVKRDAITVATIADLASTTFTETVPDAKSYTYDVYAKYANGMVSDKQSVIVDLSTLATTNVKSEKGMAVFPNPSSGPFTIVAGQDMGRFEAQVFDMSGRLIMSKKSTGTTMDIDLTGSGKGMYILNVTDSNSKRTSVKLIVK